MPLCCSEKDWSEVKRIAEEIAIPKYTGNVPLPENTIYIEYNESLSDDIVPEMNASLKDFEDEGSITIRVKEHYYDKKKEIMEIFRN